MTSIKQTYISGAISGRPRKEAEDHFTRVKEHLLIEGHLVLSPYVTRFQYSKRKDYSWSDWMRESIVAMMDCDTIFMLNGWEDSRGASIEYKLALELGFNIQFEAQSSMPTKPELLTED